VTTATFPSSQSLSQPIDFRQVTVDIDLPCIRCGYDLRTMTTEGHCPECLAPVSWAMHGDLRVRPVRRWMDLQILGCGVSIVGVTMLLIGMICLVWIDKTPAWILTMVDLSMLVGVVGLVLLGSPELDPESPDHGWFYRPVMWFLAGLVLLAALAQQDWLRAFSYRLALVWPDYRLLTMTMILRAAWVIAIAYLRRLAPRFGAERLVPETYLFLFGVLVAVACQWAAYTGMPMFQIRPPDWWLSMVRWLWFFQGLWAVTLFMRYGLALLQARNPRREQPLIPA